MTYSDKSTDIVPPAINPVPNGVERPFWSVMMPDLQLSGSLRAGLEVGPRAGPGGRPDADCGHRRLLDQRAVGGGRRSGWLLGGSSSTASTRMSGWLATGTHASVRSRGLWVHLLHQDDLVLPGLLRDDGTIAPGPADVGAAFCRHAYFNDVGERTSVSELGAEDGGNPGGLAREDRRGTAYRVPVDRRPPRRLTSSSGGFTPELYASPWTGRCGCGSRPTTRSGTSPKSWPVTAGTTPTRP